jgi:membrane associated rhomboid family serine protease
VTFILLFAILAVLAFKMTSPEDREQYLGIALEYVRALKAAAAETGPEREFRESLLARTPRLLATPALVAINVMIVAGMLFGAAAIGDPDTLMAWGASLGPRTTNGEWWRLVTSAFVHTGTLHLLINAVVLFQVGAVLERLVGRLAFTGVYLSAGVFAGLVNLSSSPLVVTTSASAAVFGLYGLLFASACWELFQQRGADTPHDVGTVVREDAPTPELYEIVEPWVPMPLRSMKRLGAGAAVFLVFSALNGFVHTAEWTGLLAGAVSGLVIGRRVDGDKPQINRVAVAMAAAVVFAIACAVPLRNIAKVKPEIVNVFATEERTAAAYRSASDAFAKGRVTAEALAQLAERTIVSELQAADARLKALENVPLEQQPLVADARDYLRLRSASWRARAEAIRKTNPDARRAPKPAADTVSRSQAEARFRSNQTALGNAEGAERAARDAFQRIKSARLL